MQQQTRNIDKFLMMFVALLIRISSKSKHDKR